jgi:hypothetical protein
MLIMDNNLMMKTIAKYLREAKKEGEVVYFDIDGTILECGDGVYNDETEKSYYLTPLGEMMVHSKYPLHILTVGGVSKEFLESMGFNIASHHGPIDGRIAGLIEEHDWDTSKSVKYLIDNEIHPLSPNQILVNFQ